MGRLRKHLVVLGVGWSMHQSRLDFAPRRLLETPWGIPELKFLICQVLDIKGAIHRCGCFGYNMMYVLTASSSLISWAWVSLKSLDVPHSLTLLLLAQSVLCRKSVSRRSPDLVAIEIKGPFLDIQKRNLFKQGLHETDVVCPMLALVTS